MEEEPLSTTETFVTQGDDIDGSVPRGSTMQRGKTLNRVGTLQRKSSLQRAATLRDQDEDEGRSDIVDEKQEETALTTVPNGKRSIVVYSEEDPRYSKIKAKIEQLECPKCSHIDIDVRVQQRLRILDPSQRKPTRAARPGVQMKGAKIRIAPAEKKLPAYCQKIPTPGVGRGAAWNCAFDFDLYYMESTESRDQNDTALVSELVQARRVEEMLIDFENRTDFDNGLPVKILATPVPGTNDWVAVTGDVYYMNTATGEKTFQAPRRRKEKKSKQAAYQYRTVSPTYSEGSARFQNNQGRKGSRSPNKSLRSTNEWSPNSGGMDLTIGGYLPPILDYGENRSNAGLTTSHDLSRSSPLA